MAMADGVGCTRTAVGAGVEAGISLSVEAEVRKEMLVAFLLKGDEALLLHNHI